MRLKGEEEVTEEEGRERKSVEKTREENCLDGRGMRSREGKTEEMKEGREEKTSDVICWGQ